MPQEVSLFDALEDRQELLRGGGGVKGRTEIFSHRYEDIISAENLLEAWKEFLRGKRAKPDVQEFEADLMSNVLDLHRELKNKTYKHGGYRHFKIADPKPRDIHKASVRDRLLHHALYRRLYPFFDRSFIYDSYSCRLGKGTHKAINRFRSFAYKVSKNHTRTCFVLKCDVRKFFASIDHGILFGILQKHITDPDTLQLLQEVVGSFKTQTHKSDIGCLISEKGLPLGNLTSQLLVNVYMDEFDHFVKRDLKAAHYMRYADDFVILSHDKRQLEQVLRHVAVFLEEKLKLKLHPDKVFIKTFASGVDFLGWVHFADHRVLRAAARRRMARRLTERRGREGEQATKQSYAGLLSHGNARTLEKMLLSDTIGQ